MSQSSPAVPILEQDPPVRSLNPSPAEAQLEPSRDSSSPLAVNLAKAGLEQDVHEHPLNASLVEPQLQPSKDSSNPQAVNLPSAEASSHPPSQPASSALKIDIFISYHFADRAIAQDLANVLQDEGWSVWWDRTILPGRRFDAAIEAALDAAKCVIVLWSSTSIDSDWVKVEAAEAARRRILIPAMIADVKAPLEFRRIQSANLIGWSGPPHPGFQSLLASINDFVGRSPHSPVN